MIKAGGGDVVEEAAAEIPAAENLRGAEEDRTEAVLRQNLARDGGLPASIALAALLTENGALEEAASLLTSTPGAEANFEALNLLSLIQYQRRDFDACRRTLNGLIARAPQAPLAVYQRLSKVLAAQGDPDEARAVLARGVAAHGQATEFVTAYADMLPPDAAIGELERHLDVVRMDPARTAYVLTRLSHLKAPVLRAACGRSLYGTSWPDTYQWPDAQALPTLKGALLREVAAGSRRASAWADLACVAIAEGNWAQAEAHFARLRNGPKRTMADFHAFGGAFHAELEAMSEAEIAAGLPAVQPLTAPAAPAGVTVFIGSDPVYFTRFTLPFIREVEAARLPLHIHAHVLDGTSEAWADMARALEGLAFVRVFLTAEPSGAALKGATYAKLYYHAVRYIRAFEALNRARRPMWVLDADVRLLRDPRPLFAALERYDVALSTRPAEFSPALKMSATCVGLAPSPRGLEFARRVAAYIAYWKKRDRWGWGVDQAALFSAYAHMSAAARQPATLFLDDAAINDKSGDGGALKFYSGIDKYTAPP